MTCYFAIFHTKGKLVKCLEWFKAAVLQMLKNKNKLKLTVNTGQVMFSGDIYYY